MSLHTVSWRPPYLGHARRKDIVLYTSKASSSLTSRSARASPSSLEGGFVGTRPSLFRRQGRVPSWARHTVLRPSCPSRPGAPHRNTAERDFPTFRCLEGVRCVETSCRKGQAHASLSLSPANSWAWAQPKCMKPEGHMNKNRKS